MDTLAEYEKSLRDLIKGRSRLPSDDRYFAQVALSPGLAVVQKSAVWWLAMAVERHCVWTVRLLKRLGAFHSCVAAFYRERSPSPYAEKAAEQFLDHTSEFSESLARTLAGFELAVQRVRRGDMEEYCLEWDRNPDTVFACLLSGAELPAPEAGSRYLTYVSTQIRGFVRCDHITVADEI